MPKAITATMHDMAILLADQLSANQGTTPEGYLICKNVPVSGIRPQEYIESEIFKNGSPSKRIKAYRLPEDVFDETSLQSLESKPVTDDHPSGSVDIRNVGFLAKGHARNVRHDDKNVIADLVITDPGLIEGIRAKRKYEISLGYTCQYTAYKDGMRQTNIRVNHIAVVESGRAGSKVAIKDQSPVSAQKRRNPMDKNTALATMFAAFAKDASPEELLAMLPFVTDSKPAVVEPEKADKGLLALITGLMAKDSKPAAVVEAPAALTADDVKKLIADGIAEGLKASATKDKKAKDTDEKEVEKMLEDEDPDEEKKTEDEDPDEEKKTEDADEETKEAKDADFAKLVKAIQPLYKKLPVKDQKVVKDAILQAKKNPTADAYAGILKAVQSHKTQDAAPFADPSALSRAVMAERNPHYAKKA